MSRTESEIVDWMHRSMEETPVMRLLGARPISYDAEARRVVIEYLAKPEFCNLIGTVQGGMLTAMLDNALSFAILGAIEPGHVAPSIEIKTSYLSPAVPGAIIGEASVIRLGRTVSFVEGRLTDPGGSLLATATGSARIRPR